MFETSTENVHEQLFHPTWNFELFYGLHSEDLRQALCFKAMFQRCVKSETFFLLLALRSDNLVAKLTHLQLGPLR